MKKLIFFFALLFVAIGLKANEAQYYLCEAAKAMGSATARAYIASELMGEDIGPQKKAIFDNLESAKVHMRTVENLIVDPFARIRKRNNTLQVAIRRIESFMKDYDRILPQHREGKLKGIYGAYLAGFEYTYNSARIDSIQQKPTCDTEILATCYNYGIALIASETAGDPDRPRFIWKYQFSANSAMNGTIDDGLWLAMDPGHREPDGHVEKICCGFGPPDDWDLFPNFTAESPTIA